MNHKTEPDASAFASTTHGAEGHLVNAPEFGLTKREYFAALAMQGMLANSHTRESVIRQTAIKDIKEPGHIAQLYAEAAVRQADALIQALNAQGGGEG